MTVEAKVKTPKLSKTKLTLTAGGKATLKVTNAKGKVTWKTSNKKIATVTNGKVTAKKKGTAKITATAGGEGLYYVYSGLNALMTDEIEVSDMKEVKGSVNVTLKKGQYLQTVDCRIE